MNLNSFWFTFGPLIAVNTYVTLALILFFFISKNRPKDKEIEERHSSLILNKWIREFWMWLLNPLYRILVFFKFTPNVISLLGTVLACLSALAFVFNHIGLGGWVMVLGASFDFFDGRIARETGQTSRAGSFFDSSMDRVSEGATLTGIAFMYRHDTLGFFIVMAVYLGSMLTSYTKSKGETMGVDYSGGMMQRPERLAYLGAGAIVTPMLAYFIYPYIGDKVTDIFMLEKCLYLLPVAFVGVFCNLAAYNRIVNIMQRLK